MRMIEKDVKSLAQMRMGGKRTSLYATEAQTILSQTIQRLKNSGKFTEDELKAYADPLQEVSFVIGKHDAFIEDLTEKIIDIYKLDFRHEMKYNQYPDDFLNTIAGLMNFLAEQLRPQVIGQATLQSLLSCINSKPMLFMVTNVQGEIRQVISHQVEQFDESAYLGKNLKKMLNPVKSLDKSLNKKVAIPSTLLVGGKLLNCKLSSRLLLCEEELEGLVVAVHLSEE